MEVTPVRLVGPTVILEPLQQHHAAGLLAAGDDDVFAYIGTKPFAQTHDEYARYVGQLLQTPAMCPFAVTENASGQAIGVTTYMDIRPAHRGLEIGSTWLGRAHHGTAVNPECKYLLLRHAFEQLGAVRVQLKTDGRNLQSQAAIAKLGAQREGVLRKHLILPDGYIRDTVMFSIVADEWPQVKTHLAARLAALGVIVD